MSKTVGNVTKGATVWGEKTLKAKESQMDAEAKYERILKYFKYEHLPEHLQEVSKPFSELAHSMVKLDSLSGGEVAEVMAGLRKLLEAKDCAVRSLIR